MALANGFIIINVGGGPTLNIRVADIQAVYEGWNSRGAEVLDRGPKKANAASRSKNS